jgi:hypothetical protein
MPKFLLNIVRTETYDATIEVEAPSREAAIEQTQRKLDKAGWDSVCDTEGEYLECWFNVVPARIAQPVTAFNAAVAILLSGGTDIFLASDDKHDVYIFPQAVVVTGEKRDPEEHFVEYQVCEKLGDHLETYRSFPDAMFRFREIVKSGGWLKIPPLSPDPELQVSHDELVRLLFRVALFSGSWHEIRVLSEDMKSTLDRAYAKTRDVALRTMITSILEPKKDDRHA